MHEVIFFNDTATTEIYTLSLHDALPILHGDLAAGRAGRVDAVDDPDGDGGDHDAEEQDQPEQHEPEAAEPAGDRKSTGLNSSHANISYAVFCLKKSAKITYGVNTQPHDV